MARVSPHSGLLSPARSEVSAVVTVTDSLPVPRSHPLIPGSQKESQLINFIDGRILNITRRYAKSLAADATDRSHGSGYTDFTQVIVDINAVLDVVWVSATPTLQIPYLLALAGHFRGFMHSFQFVTTSFTLARKFDAAFASLLTTPARDANVSSAIDMTQKVRIRSLAQETRYEMIEAASNSGRSVEYEEPEDTDDDPEDETDFSDGESPAQGYIPLSLGKVYEKTLEILGGDLTSLPSADSGVQPEPHETTMDDVETIDL